MPITEELDTQVEEPCVPEPKKSLRVSIVIPALEPSPVSDKENDTTSEISTVRFDSADGAFLFSLEDGSWDTLSRGKNYQKKTKNIEKQKGNSVMTKQHKCKFCSRHFKSSQALGGHTSKAHPAMSTQYAKKMQVR